jgi:enoyl-[acyl-carrier-protein] reductase (NADH)
VEVARGGPGESSPGQIAAVVTFLVSPLAAAVSGEAIAVGHRVRGVLAL